MEFICGQILIPQAIFPNGRGSHRGCFYANLNHTVHFRVIRTSWLILQISIKYYFKILIYSYNVHTLINWKHTLFKAEFLFNYITRGCIIAWLMYRHPNNWLVLYAFCYSYNLLRVMIDCQRFFFFRNRVNEWPARDLIIFSILCMISPYSI